MSEIYAYQQKYVDVAGALERCEFRVMTGRRAKEFDETIEVEGGRMSPGIRERSRVIYGC